MIACKHCDRSTGSSADVARVEGWRMFSGASQTGKPLDDVVCPTCAGTAKPAVEEPSWQVRCNTCDWVWEDEWDEGPLTVTEAKQVAADHECESWVEIAAPGDGPWVSPSYVNKDGTLRPGALVRST